MSTAAAAYVGSTPTSLSGLWIEDDPMFLKDNIPRLESRGIPMEGVATGDEGIERLREWRFRYTHVLLDLAMPGKDGKEVYSILREIDPDIPIIIVSAHNREPAWKAWIGTLDEKIDIIEKPFPMDQSDDFPPLLDLIREVRHESLQKRIFERDIESFMELDEKEMDQVFEAADFANYEYVNQFFENHDDADWVAISLEPGNVISYGAREQEPLEEDIQKTAESLGYPVFVYSRPQPIEEVPPDEWSRKSPDDFYPTVRFEFEDTKGTKTHVSGDFDTGSPLSFVSYEDLQDLNIVGKMFWRVKSSDALWGVRYSYYNKVFPIHFVSADLRKPGVLRCRIVRNWKESPQVRHYNDRVAFIGRNILTDNNLVLVLDGERKRTYLLGDT